MNNKTTPIIIIVLAILVIMAALWLVLWQSTKPSNQNTNQANINQTESKINFNYSDGEEPWLKNTNTEGSETESKIYLPIWKKTFQTVNNVDDNYFNSHVFVARTWKSEFKDPIRDEKLTKIFFVHYYFKVDWARISLEDNFVYSVESIGDGITAEELIRDFNTPVWTSRKYKESIDIAKLKPIIHVAGEEQIVKAAQNVIKNVSFDVNTNMIIEEDGQLALQIYGVINRSANRCLRGTIILENAKVSRVGETVCWIE